MSSAARDTIRKPFIEHISELRMRLTWVALAVIVAAGAAFSINQKLLEIIQKPLNQTLYFTSPTGGLSFIFQLCLTVGIVVAFPVIVYHAYQFLSPLLAKKRRVSIFMYISFSFLLACAGVAFAYFISLPAALKFLTQFGGEGIESLIKADEYFSFALTYIAGFAIMFQIPLAVLFINSIKPLGPGGMMKSQRWVILFSFVGAAMITPTPDPINQALMAAPAIVLYQFSILLVLAVNRGRRPKKVKYHQVAPAQCHSKKLAGSAIKGSFLLTPVTTTKNISDFVSVSPLQSQSKRQSLRLPSRPVVGRPLRVQPRKQPTSIANRRLQSIDGIL